MNELPLIQTKKNTLFFHKNHFFHLFFNEIIIFFLFCINFLYIFSIFFYIFSKSHNFIANISENSVKSLPDRTSFVKFKGIPAGFLIWKPSMKSKNRKVNKLRFQFKELERDGSIFPLRFWIAKRPTKQQQSATDLHFVSLKRHSLSFLLDFFLNFYSL